MDALQIQVERDFEPYWGRTANLVFFGGVLCMMPGRSSALRRFDFMRSPSRQIGL